MGKKEKRKQVVMGTGAYRTTGPPSAGGCDLDIKKEGEAVCQGQSLLSRITIAATAAASSAGGVVHVCTLKRKSIDLATSVTAVRQRCLRP